MVNQKIERKRVLNLPNSNLIAGSNYELYLGGGVYRNYVVNDSLQLVAQDGKEFIECDTVNDLRSLDSRQIWAIQNGYYKGVKLNGYYAKGDTPTPIEYYLSDTAEEDDGGSVFEIGGIKLEHYFSGEVDIRYFGAKGDGQTDNSAYVRKSLDYISKKFENGGSVIFAAGTYLILSRIIIPCVVGQKFYCIIKGNGTFIKGAGPGLGTIFETGKTSYSTNGESNFDDTPELYIHAKLRIEGITFSDCDIAIKGYNIIFNSSINNCYFTALNTSIWLKRSFYTNITNCTSRLGYLNRPTTAVGIKLESYANVINLINTHTSGIYSNTPTGIALQLQGANGFNAFNCAFEGSKIGFNIIGDNYPVSIEGCYFEANEVGISHKTGTLSNTSIRNNFFFGNTVNHVDISGWTSGVWENNFSPTSDLNVFNFNYTTNSFTLYLPQFTRANTATTNGTAIPTNYSVANSIHLDGNYNEFNSAVGFGSVVAKNLNIISNSRVKLNYSGNPAITGVPFCLVTNNSATTGTYFIDTDIVFSSYTGGIEFDFTVLDTTSSYNLSGRLLNNSQIFRYDGSSKVITASDNAGKLRLTLSTFTTGNINGKIRIT